MASGGYGKKKKVAGGGGHPPKNKGTNTQLKVNKNKNDKKKKKQLKKPSIKNQIRSIERLLKKNLPQEFRDAQEKKLEELTKLMNIQTQTQLERKMALRYRRVKFFERRKIERRIRRLEKQQRIALEPRGDEIDMQAGEIHKQLAQLKEDLEYVRYFPKSEKYVSLFMGGDDPELVAKRNKLRELIKANLVAAAASGIELETGSDDDGNMDVSEDDFFLDGSSSDDADADDEWTDKSTRDLASCASGKATTGVSSDEINKLVKPGTSLRAPPQSQQSSYVREKTRPARPGKNPTISKGHYRHEASNKFGKSGASSSNSEFIRNRSGYGVSLRGGHSSGNRTGGQLRRPVGKEKFGGCDPSSGSEILKGTSSQGGTISSNSDVQQKRKRKRRPKKKK